MPRTVSKPASPSKPLGMPHIIVSVILKNMTDKTGGKNRDRKKPISRDISVAGERMDWGRVEM